MKFLLMFVCNNLWSISEKAKSQKLTLYSIYILLNTYIYVMIWEISNCEKKTDTSFY